KPLRFLEALSHPMLCARQRARRKLRVSPCTKSAPRASHAPGGSQARHMAECREMLLPARMLPAGGSPPGLCASVRPPRMAKANRRTSIFA
ncbi:hypothetical protein HAX54_009807, partial [Datura stramonium]|nr:hypothetical protein [Datura stramonium]